jgi:hypothetical protein
MVAPARKAQSKNCPLVNCPNETMPGGALAEHAGNAPLAGDSRFPPAF